MPLQAPRDRRGFHIAIICALPLEAECVLATFDKTWKNQEYGKAVGDSNAYSMGLIAGHPVVLAHMPAMGKVNAAIVAAGLHSSFVNIRLALVVGICGGIPQGSCGEIFLGDVVLSQGVVQYNFGKQYPGGFEGKNTIKESQPSPEIASVLARLQTSPYRKQMEQDMLVHLRALQGSLSETQQPALETDMLFQRNYVHKHRVNANEGACAICESGPERICPLALSMTCDKLGCEEQGLSRHRSALATYGSGRAPVVEPRLHVGRMGSGDTVIKSGKHRDRFADQYSVIAFEMEGAGAFSHFPNGLVIKGVCDYADSHKSKLWQLYSAATAAASTKSLLGELCTNAELDEQEGPVRPLWHMPFIRSDLQDLVGRHDKLDILESKLFGTSKRGTVALLGLGGVGKSRLAMEVTYIARAQHPACSVFWVQATDAAAVERDYLAIGALLQIPGVHSGQLDIKQSVCRFLTERSGREWLLVIDNADDAILWGEGQSATSGWSSLVEYLPKNPTGSILVTTRNRGVATYLAGKDVVDLTEMDAGGAEGMLANLLEEPEILRDRRSTRDLLEKLTCLPLAIVQAASYINKNQVSVTDYLNLLEQPEHNIIELLSEDFNDKTRYSNVRNPVASTWLVSFKQIQERSPLAAEYLALISCVGEKSIPQSLLPSAASAKEIVDAIGVLKGYAFLRKQGEDDVLGSIYDMHRLVRIATRNWLMQEGTLKKWTEIALRRMQMTFTRSGWEDRNFWMVYLPHAQVLCDSWLSEDFSDRYRLLLVISLCLRWTGKDHDADKLIESVIEWAGRNPDGNQELLCEAYALLIGKLGAVGRLVEAEKYMTQAFHRRKENLGSEDVGTIESIINLACIYDEQGRLQAAEKLFKDVISIARRVLGSGHYLLLGAIEALVQTHIQQDNYHDAEVLQLEAVKTTQSTHGPDHSDVLDKMSALSEIYKRQNRLEEAEALSLKVYKAWQQALGPEHPDTLDALVDLGRVYHRQGRNKEAEKLAMKCLEVRLKVFGREDAGAEPPMRLLASIRQDQGRTEDVVKLMAECLRILERTDAIHDPYTSSLREALNRWRASLGCITPSAPPAEAPCPTEQHDIDVFADGDSQHSHHLPVRKKRRLGR